MSRQDSLSQGEIVDLLRQHVEAGCTDVLADAPVNHYAAALAEAAQPPLPATIPAAEHTRDGQAQKGAHDGDPSLAATAHPQPVDRVSADGETARNLAAAAKDLPALKKAMDNFEGCAFRKTAKNTVFCDGVDSAKIMLIGEAPGQDEDRQGKPFVGRSGQLMDKMLAAIGISRTENLYISNIVPWRPPGNRTPSSDEIALCAPFIARHIELVQPEILLLVGNISNKTLLNTSTGITKLRGQWQTYQADGLAIAALPLLHPAYVLRRPEVKADMWADLSALKARLSSR